MALALITTNPMAVVQVFGGNSATVNIPALWSVQNALDGWTSPDGLYKLTMVIPFVVPNGQQITGSATYSVDVNGTVTQTYTTQAISPQTKIPYQVLLGRLTDVEYTNIKKAIATQITAGNATVARWYDGVLNSSFIDTSLPITTTVKAAAVSAGLLTQARADIIFTP